MKPRATDTQKSGHIAYQKFNQILHFALFFKDCHCFSFMCVINRFLHKLFLDKNAEATNLMKNMKKKEICHISIALKSL